MMSKRKHETHEQYLARHREAQRKRSQRPEVKAKKAEADRKRKERLEVKATLAEASRKWRADERHMKLLTTLAELNRILTGEPKHAD